MKHGKNYADSAKLVDRSKLYETEEALALVCQTAKAKFDETVELHIRLGVDGRQADQQVRGAVVLPNGTGKDVRVVCICKGDHAKAAEEAGAFLVGDADGADASVAAPPCSSRPVLPSVPAAAPQLHAGRVPPPCASNCRAVQRYAGAAVEKNAAVIFRSVWTLACLG